MPLFSEYEFIGDRCQIKVSSRLRCFCHSSSMVFDECLLDKQTAEKKNTQIFNLWHSEYILQVYGKRGQTRPQVRTPTTQWTSRSRAEHSTIHNGDCLKQIADFFSYRVVLMLTNERASEYCVHILYLCLRFCWTMPKVRAGQVDRASAVHSINHRHDDDELSHHSELFNINETKYSCRLYMKCSSVIITRTCVDRTVSYIISLSRRWWWCRKVIRDHLEFWLDTSNIICWAISLATTRRLSLTSYIRSAILTVFVIAYSR